MDGKREAASLIRVSHGNGIPRMLPSKSDLFRTECVLVYTGRTGPKYCTANDLYETDFLQKAFSLLGTKGFSFRS